MGLTPHKQTNKQTDWNTPIIKKSTIQWKQSSLFVQNWYMYTVQTISNTLFTLDSKVTVN